MLASVGKCELRWLRWGMWGMWLRWGMSQDCGLEPFAMKLEFKMMRIRCFSTRAREAQTTAVALRPEHVKHEPLLFDPST